MKTKTSKRFSVDAIMALHPCWPRKRVQAYFDRAGKKTITLKDVAKARLDLLKRFEANIHSKRLSKASHDFGWLLNRLARCVTEREMHLTANLLHTVDNSGNYIPLPDRLRALIAAL